MTDTSIVPFNFEGNEIRVVNDVDNDPWFVAADVCKVLTIAHVASATRDLDADEKGVHDLHTPGGPQGMAILSESGLYTLILRSNKPEARAFRKWVTSAVLPEIRRTGRFEAVPQHNIPQTYPDALRLAADLADEVDRLKPKGIFYDKVRCAEGHLTVAQVAKTLGTGELRLFSMLRGRGFLMRNNQPFQEYIEQGWFHVVTKTGSWGGKEQVWQQTVITGKGLTEIHEALKDLLPPPRKEAQRPKQQGLPGLLN